MEEREKMKIDLDKKWKEALKKTKIVRSRYAKLNTFSKTVLPYILVSKSLVNVNSTVVREGKVEVSPVMIHLPDGSPIFNGFNFFETTEYSEEVVKTFLLIRGIKLPSLKYSNEEVKLDVIEKGVEEVVKEYQQKLACREDLETAIIVGLGDVWQFSLLVYILSNIARSAESDVRNIFSSLE